MMATAAQDLWPTEIGEYDQVSPVSILKSQASRLGVRTDDRVTARVETVASGAEFRHAFFIVARQLRYEYELFIVTHSIDFYPLKIHFEGFNRVESATSEEEFIDLLGKVFRSERTTRLINSLLAQVEA
jgi:hypothetical protein